MKQREPEQTRGTGARGALLSGGVQRIKRAVIGGSEMILAVVLVLFFFAVFTGILVASFPKGSGLSNLYGDLMDRGRADSSVTLGLPARIFVAELAQVNHRVKDRPPHDVAWRSSSTGLALSNNHAVQTFDDSTASIKFESAGTLFLGPNSLVVLRQQQTAYHMLRDQAALVVLGGEVRGLLPQVGSDGVGLEIVAGGATARLISAEGEAAEFALTVHEDKSATLQILAGSAEVKAGGETALVGADEALTLRPSVSLGSPVPLPRTPRLLSPADGSRRSYGRAAPRVEMRWRENETGDYRLVIARDRELTDLVHESHLRDNVFEIGNLTEGNYFWTVTGVMGQIRGRSAEVRSFKLVRDLEPPSLSVELPGETVETARMLVRGQTDPGAKVLVGHNEAPTEESGEFELMVDLRSGPNIIVVEAVDEVGNVAYFSQYVNAKLRASGNRQ